MTLTARLRSVPVSNATYGIAEYVSLPILMLCSAPVLLHRLGAEEYAIWLLSSAAVTGGLLLSGGFGDAALKYIAACRGSNDEAGIERIIRTLLAINLSLGVVVASVLWLLIPLLVQFLPNLSVASQSSYRRALGIGCVVLLVKAVESVFLCAQRACERYDIAAKFTIATRVATVGAAVALAMAGHDSVAILWATLCIAIVSLGIQMEMVRRHFALRSLWPSWRRDSVRQLLEFGCFSWLQGLVGLFTGQADRFLVGYLLGAQSLAYYSICVQMSLPIHGIAAAGLQVLFPYLAARLDVISLKEARRKLAAAFAANVSLVAVLSVPVVLGGHFILRVWMGQDFAAHASVALSVIAFGFALMGLNVTGFYVLMALGRIKLVAVVNILGAVVMLVAIAVLAPRFGIVGAGVGRLFYGPITWLTYRALVNAFRTPQNISGEAPVMMGAL